MSTTLTHVTNASPFDSIRQVRADGSEFWSARDLMPLLGYEKWERFEDAIDRAKISAKTQGHQAADHFPGAGKVIPGGRWGEQTVSDFHLTRFACYLVAMNGDPRKPEIAAAQGYFAVKTREAEVTIDSILENPDLGIQLLTEVKERRKALAEADAALAIAAPKAKALDALADDEEATVTVEQLGKAVGLTRAATFDRLAELDIVYKRELDGVHHAYQDYAHMFTHRFVRVVAWKPKYEQLVVRAAYVGVLQDALRSL